MKFREIELASGVKVSLGKDEKNNDELMKKFKGKSNTILHTAAPGSPFCVIKKEKPSLKDVYLSGSACASYSQDWRDNKRNVIMHKFTGKDVSKKKGMKTGTWDVKKFKRIKIKKKNILKFENDSRTSTTRKKRSN